MGLSDDLVVFPIAVLMVIIVAEGLSFYGQGSTPFCPGATGSMSCTSTSQGVTYTCGTNTVACLLPYNCPAPLPAQTFCVTGNGLPPGVTQWYLNAGTAILLTTSSMSSLGPVVNTQSTSLSFGPLTAQGFELMLVTTTGLLVLAAVNFFGSGLNSEGIHISFEMGLILGIWGILSAVEGFIVGSPNSFFVQLNNLKGWSGVGSLMYLVLTLLITLGSIGTVSRSAGGPGGM